MREHSSHEREETTSTRLIDRLLRHRALIYIAILGGVVLWKMWPSMAPSIAKIKGLAEDTDGQIVIAGTDAARDLVIETIAQFRSEYPNVQIAMSPGGTVNALEDLINHRAHIAVLSRPPTPREQEIAVSRGDSLLYFPVALGGITFLTGRSSGIGTLQMNDLRAMVSTGLGSLNVAGSNRRVYGPDPNGGLWEALLARLEYRAQPAYIPVDGGHRVLSAIRKDPTAVGFASSLTYELAPDDPDVAVVALALDDSDEPRAPTKANIVNGSYPLYHYIYFCTTASRGALASGFVTYYSQPTGQKWFARRGFLPAQLPAREIRLTGGTPS